jgi:hypothetical protein
MASPAARSSIARSRNFLVSRFCVCSLELVKIFQLSCHKNLECTNHLRAIMVVCNLKANFESIVT